MLVMQGGRHDKGGGWSNGRELYSGSTGEGSRRRASQSYPTLVDPPEHTLSLTYDPPRTELACDLRDVPRYSIQSVTFDLLSSLPAYHGLHPDFHPDDHPGYTISRIPASQADQYTDTKYTIGPLTISSPLLHPINAIKFPFLERVTQLSPADLSNLEYAMMMGSWMSWALKESNLASPVADRLSKASGDRHVLPPYIYRYVYPRVSFSIVVFWEASSTDSCRGRRSCDSCRLAAVSSADPSLDLGYCLFCSTGAPTSAGGGTVPLDPCTRCLKLGLACRFQVPDLHSGLVYEGALVHLVPRPDHSTQNEDDGTAADIWYDKTASRSRSAGRTELGDLALVAGRKRKRELDTTSAPRSVDVLHGLTPSERLMRVSDLPRSCIPSLIPCHSLFSAFFMKEILIPIYWTQWLVATSSLKSHRYSKHFEKVSSRNV